MNYEPRVFDFSIIIPTHNSELTINRAISSITENKSRNKIEILIIDDGSTDNTIRIIKQIANKYNYIRLLFNRDHGGPGSSRNIGIDAARGSYILFLDSDDWFDSDLLSILSTCMKSQPDIISYDFCVNDGSIIKYPAKELIRNRRPEVNHSTGFEAKRYLYKEQISNYIWSYAFKTLFLKRKHIRFSESCYILEDVLFLNESLTKCDRVSYINSTYLYNYYVNKKSISRAPCRRFGEMGLSNYLASKNYFFDTNDYPNYFLSLLLFIIYLYGREISISDFAVLDREVKDVVNIYNFNKIDLKNIFRLLHFRIKYFCKKVSNVSKIYSH